jgi:hypothetical protein
MRRLPLISALPVAALTLIGPLGASPTPWRDLRRPLHLPKVAPGTSCPVSRIDRRIDWRRVKFPGSPGVGRGPVYPGLGEAGGRLTATPDVQYGGPWAGGKVFWYVRPRYRGPVLIRGHRLDGPQRLGFNGLRLPARELRIERGITVSWDGRPPGSRGIPSDVRVRTAGCYGVQIDGRSFSRIVIFTVEVS